MSDNSKNAIKMGCCEVLTLIFIVLKLVDVIDWSWWWVLSPLWIPFAIVILITLVGIILNLLI